MKPPPESATGAHPADDFEERSTTEAAPDTELRLSLVVCSADGVQVAPLAPDRPLIVGREPGCGVVVSDQGVSRKHARFEVEGELVWVVDLESRNGTLVNGTSIERAQLTTRDEVMLGPVSVTLRRTPRHEEAAIGLTSHDLFQNLLAREVASGRKVSLLMIWAEREGEASFTRWCKRVAGDVGGAPIGLYGPNTIEVLLPDSDQTAAALLATRLVDSGTAMGMRLHCGIACHPDAASSAEELIEVSRAALHRAPPAGFAVASTTDPDRADKPIVGSPAMVSVLEAIDRFKSSKVPVLIQGETGTGKEVVARALHQGGARREQPFRSINCAAIPAQLTESLLFGHRRGAFTGADSDEKGLFQEAHGGSLLLDEIGDLPLPAQAALLRAIETKRVMPVGSSSEIEVDVRIIAATHQNLEEMCAAGTFRSDLLFRLNTVTVKLPPLRERKEEIEPLTEQFILRANRDNDCHVRMISGEALDLLLAHDWPGNIRELRNVIERAVVLAGGGVITPNELPDRLKRERSAAAPVPSGDFIDVPTDRLKVESLDLKSQLQRFEVSVIKDALARSGGNQSRAAELLVMPRRTLVHKLRTYGIDRGAKAEGTSMLMGEDGLPLDFAAQVAHQEQAIIRRTMDRCRGDQARAARMLGIAPKVLARKLGEPK